MPNNDLRKFSLMRRDLWDAAEWFDVMFLMVPDFSRQPGIGLRFRDYDAGCRIFTDWRERFGQADRHEVLRVSFISGTHPTRGEGYTIHFTTDPDGVTRQDTEEAHLALETHTFVESRSLFHPSTSTAALDSFRSCFERHRMYFIMPLPATGMVEPDPSRLLGKKRIYFRTFDEIAPQDIDSMAVAP